MGQLEGISVGIVTLSDRASRGEYEDASGPAIESYLRDHIANPLEVFYRLMADEQTLIQQILIDLCDDRNCALVCTTGGTGPTLRDVTPEATAAVSRIILPGFGEHMRRVSVEEVPTAPLSRQTAGIRGSSLILNLPGNPNAIAVCLNAVIRAIPGAVHLVGGPGIVLKNL